MKYLLVLMLQLISLNGFASKPPLLLANHYKSHVPIKDYWVSEKLDGVRAYWNGESLISKQGHIFYAPKWFINDLPKIPLDGELWIGRNQFDKVSGLVRGQGDNVVAWKSIRYMIFDLPNSLETFDKRIEKMKAIVQKVSVGHFKMIKQFKINSHKELKNKLNSIVELGGEGFMLHRGSSYYKQGRSNDLMKLKKYFDAEATVIKHIKGKGKFSRMLGAILVETKDRIRFKIGTGFSEQERKKPPPIGAVITYKYFGLTSKGKPRFASYMRIR